MKNQKKQIKNIVHNIGVVNEASHLLTHLSYVGKALNSQTVRQ